MSVATPEEFFEVLQKSKLLTPAQMVEARKIVEEGDDPKSIAKRLARRELITRWQAGQLLAGRSSFYLGKYRLIELLGRGGMGNVFLGRHVTMNRLVALKIISRQVGKDPASLEMFLAEARAIAALDHPNIVQAYSVDFDGGRYYIVMEYVEGLDLQQMVEEDGPLDSRLAVEYIRQAAEGLEHAHQRNMIHCDVKPSNLLVNMQGVVKILDLGLARLTHEERPKLSDSQERVLGSVDYLAPEQALESGELDRRADIYSLGCTLYFLLSGHPPFPKGTLAERILKHQTQPPPKLRGDVPAELNAVCAKMMAKRPDDRYATAAEVGRALSKWKLSADSFKRVVPLHMAQPLKDFSDSDIFGLGLDETHSRQSTMDRSRSNWIVRPFELLFATPLRSSIVIVTCSIILLSVLYYYCENCFRMDHPAVTQAVQTKPAPAPQTPSAPRSEEAAKPPVTEPPLPLEIPYDLEQGEYPSDKPAETKSTTAADKPAAPQSPPETPITPPKAPPFETLVDLAEAVDLPKPPTKQRASDLGQAVVLGTVRLAPEELLFIDLVGGREVFPGGQSFHLERDIGADPVWIISWESKARGNRPAEHAEVASLWLENEELKLQWLAGAADSPAGYLGNCGLAVSAGEFYVLMPLSRPTIDKPVGFNTDQAIEKQLKERANMPVSGVLRMQILGFSKKFPTPEMTSGDTVAARQSTNLLFKGANLPLIKLNVEFDPKPKGAQIEHTMKFQLPGENRDRPLRMRDVIELERMALAYQKQQEQQLKKHRRYDETRKNLSKALQKTKSGTAQITALKNFCDELDTDGQMYFRVYAQYEDHQIDLIVARPPADGQGSTTINSPSSKGR